MASEIRRVGDGCVVAVGANAIRDGERYLIAILLPSSRHLFSDADLGAVFEVRDTAMFRSHSAQLELTALPTRELDIAEFRILASTETDSLAHNAA